MFAARLSRNRGSVSTGKHSSLFLCERQYRLIDTRSYLFSGDNRRPTNASFWATFCAVLDISAESKTSGGAIHIAKRRHLHSFCSPIRGIFGTTFNKCHIQAAAIVLQTMLLRAHGWTILLGPHAARALPCRARRHKSYCSVFRTLYVRA